MERLVEAFCISCKLANPLNLSVSKREFQDAIGLFSKKKRLKLR